MKYKVMILIAGRFPQLRQGCEQVQGEVRSFAGVLGTERLDCQSRSLRMVPVVLQILSGLSELLKVLSRNL